MKHAVWLMAALGLAASIAQAQTSPEEERLQIVQAVQHKFPNIRFEDYVYGALAFSPDARQQYDSLMEFPPFTSEIDKGRKLWETPFKNGKTYADCLPNRGNKVAGNYPYFDAKRNKVVTFEMALNDCRTTNGEEAYKHGDMNTMGLLTAYARTLSDGMPMNIVVKGEGALKAYEAGRNFFHQRRGQLNFSCSLCHINNVGNILRTEYLSMAPGQATHWPAFRGGVYTLFTLQRRYAVCNQMVRAVPLELGSEEYNNLEYYHSYLSNGLKLKASVFRK
jgi:sulfur-oxidizing protein SoxA